MVARHIIRDRDRLKEFLEKRAAEMEKAEQ
jgi:hypothetical protein